MIIASLWRRLPVALAVLAVAGIGISSYLTYTHYFNKEVVCGLGGQCEYVQNSNYASVGSVPLALLGIFMYGGLLLAAVYWALDVLDDRRPVLYWGLALTGTGYAAYLTYVELEVLHAICVWCVASACVLTTGLVLSTAGLLWPYEEPDELEVVRSMRQPAGQPARAQAQRSSSPR